MTVTSPPSALGRARWMPVVTADDWFETRDLGAGIHLIAEPGHVLMSADYSQIELRLAAHMADVPQLKEAFRAGADIHATGKVGVVPGDFGWNDVGIFK
jgi:hypothetical protein